MSFSSRRPAIPPYLTIFIGILAVSTASIFIRYAQEYAPSFVIAAWRLTLATLVLTIPALTRQRAELNRLTRGEVILAMISGIVLAAHFASWISSLEYTSVASSVVLVSTSPLFVALISPLFLRERLSGAALSGLILAMAGGAVVGLSDTCSWHGLQITCPSISKFLSGRAFWGDVLALLGAIAAAIYMLIGRRLRPRMTLISYTFLVYGIAALVMIGVVIASRQHFVGYPGKAYLWFLSLALIPQLLGHSTFNWALRYLSAVFVSITLLGEPIGSTLLAYFLLKEIPSNLKIFGAILILMGIFIASRGESPRAASLGKDITHEYQ